MPRTRQSLRHGTISRHPNSLIALSAGVRGHRGRGIWGFVGGVFGATHVRSDVAMTVARSRRILIFRGRCSDPVADVLDQEGAPLGEEGGGFIRRAIVADGHPSQQPAQVVWIVRRLSWSGALRAITKSTSHAMALPML